MQEHRLSVREMNLQDIPLIISYWLNASREQLQQMGVDPAKLPQKEQLQQMLESQYFLPLEQKRSFCLIWEEEGVSIGHCNTNPTFFGDHAFMHLHIWKTDNRRQGIGARGVAYSLPIFFDKLKLKTIYSEPYALNVAPNKTLEKLGFELEKEYITTPGSLNFEQPVKRWRLTIEKYQSHQ
jgi:RimJ/RimL family protein N-acetyltransferase